MRKINYKTIHTRINYLQILKNDYKIKLDNNYTILYRDKLLKVENELITLNRILMCSITMHLEGKHLSGAKNF